MPMPTPRKDEEEQAFISRCMGNETMQADFPDQEQRSAVCYRQWREAHGDEASAYTTPVCWSNHMGMYCIEIHYFMGAVALYRQGINPVWPDRGLYAAESSRGREMRPYDVVDGVAIIPVQGPLSKGGSHKFGEGSTVHMRQMIRAASRDEAVEKLMLHIYSPGGHVDGTHELAADVARAGLTKPVYAHIEDLGASAAYWVASQAQRITANATAEVGSIGTVAVLEDTSKRMDRLGIEVHVLSTGPYKGAGVDGAPLSAEALAYFRGRVESLNRHFLQAIQRGRGMTDAQVDAVSDGRVHIAQVAQSYGLIDGVESFDEAMEAARRGGETVKPPAAAPDLRHYRQVAMHKHKLTGGYV